ncbi:MAG: 2Fe-2S iron-sulfur cluster binding domain-containing protein [Rhodospirillaceae bacterium]|nr:MAG: 2Fe-2S iron-sulfur cluster binding domain-containing protein [Rhodospirillaceae bacterium]
MPKLFVTTRDGSQTAIDSKPGLTVMEVIRQHGIDELLALCGGSLNCATCHVYVDQAFVEKLPPMSSPEDELLHLSDHRQGTSRLSCQIPFSENLDGLKVTIAPDE